MLTGWTKPFELDRLLATEERHAVLSRHRQPGVQPYTYSSLIRFNSIYADFIDRSFRLRGMVNTAFGGWVALALLVFSVWFFTYMLLDLMEGNNISANLVFLVVCFVAMSFFYWFIWKKYFSKELFAYTHYPIRFNRKTRMVHVFRGKSQGGVLTVPWDEVFWHIGRGYEQKFLCDVRGHVLDGDMVSDTFAVGHYFDDDRLDRILSVWEFIRRYMDEGPEAVAEHPLDRLIHESPKPTLKNCFIHAYTSLGPGFTSLRFVLFFLFYPIVGVLTLTRWLVLNTCKEPVWPAEIEAESQVEPNDPHRWEEPNYIAEFADRPGVMERHEERMREERTRVVSGN
ncbi:DUF6708 domain-containing protein [Luteimonas sp. A277]